MFGILFVLDVPEKLKEIMDAWDEIGVVDATILESTGFHHQKRRHIPMRYIFGDSSEEENGNLTIFAVVPTEELIQRCLQATESVIGNLDLPNTGIFAAWPLLLTKGVSANWSRGSH
jgi:hypothetical protein